MSDPDQTPVARDLFTYCTKEKIDTWHVVVAQNQRGTVERVKCKSCGSDHKYRTKKATGPSQAARSLVVKRAPTQTAKEIAASSSAAVLEQTWLTGMKQWGEKPVKTFDPSIKFDQGDVFEHEVFGKGVVQSRRESRIDVLFREGLKTLPSKQS